MRFQPRQFNKYQLFILAFVILTLGSVSLIKSNESVSATYGKASRKLNELINDLTGRSYPDPLPLSENWFKRDYSTQNLSNQALVADIYRCQNSDQPSILLIGGSVAYGVGTKNEAEGFYHKLKDKISHTYCLARLSKPAVGLSWQENIFKQTNNIPSFQQIIITTGSSNAYHTLAANDIPISEPYSEDSEKELRIEHFSRSANYLIQQICKQEPKPSIHFYFEPMVSLKQTPSVREKRFQNWWHHADNILPIDYYDDFIAKSSESVSNTAASLDCNISIHKPDHFSELLNTGSEVFSALTHLNAKGTGLLSSVIARDLDRKQPSLNQRQNR